MMTQRSWLCYLSIATTLAVFGPTLNISRADTFRPVVRGRRGVVAGGQPLSVEAGMRTLQHGGNAPILIKLKGRDVAVIEGMGTAPAKATREFFVNRARQGGAVTTATAPDSSATLRAGNGNQDMPTMAGARSGMIPSTGPLAATVPAVLDACVTALDQFGTKSLAEVMQPAIELADGFPIDELRVQYITTRAPIFSQWLDAKRVFLPNGAVPRVGDVFVQADLARTLRSEEHTSELQS